MKPEDQEYMGTAEVAAYAGMTKQAIVNRRARGKLPDPVVVLRMGPIWRSSDIVRHFEELRSRHSYSRVV